MAEIKEVFEDIKDGLGDKGFLIFIGACVLLFFFNYTKQNNEELVTVTGATHYPDVGENANVVISTLQDSIQYSEDELKEYMDLNFEATAGFIQSGLDSQTQIMEESFEVVYGGIDDLKEGQAEINANVEYWGNKVYKKVKSLQASVDSLSTQKKTSSLSSAPASGTGSAVKTSSTSKDSNPTEKANVSTTVYNAIKSALAKQSTTHTSSSGVTHGGGGKSF